MILIIKVNRYNYIYIIYFIFFFKGNILFSKIGAFLFIIKDVCFVLFICQ